MLKIPLQAAPSQTLNVVLAGQQVNLNIYTQPQPPSVDVNAWEIHYGAAEQFGVGNGQVTQFRLAPTMQRNIQRMNGVMSVYANGVLTSVTISNDGIVTFSTAPATGEILTFSGSYFYYNVLPGIVAPALFMDVSVNNSAICTAIPCYNLNKIVRYAYEGFIGDFVFNDTQGTSDPTYDGLAGRYELIYLEASDL